MSSRGARESGHPRRRPGRSPSRRDRRRQQVPRADRRIDAARAPDQVAPSRCGIEAITVIAGFRADDVRAVCGGAVDLIVNDEDDRPAVCTRCGWRATSSATVSSCSMATCSSTINCCGMLLTSRDEDALLDGRDAGRALLGRGNERSASALAASPRSRKRSIRPTPTARTSASPNSVWTAPGSSSRSSPEKWPATARAPTCPVRLPPSPAGPAARRRNARVSMDRDRLSGRLTARVCPGNARHQRPRDGRESTRERVARHRRTSWGAHALCMNVSTTSANGHSISARTRTICIRAGCIRRRSTTSATASRDTPGWSSSPATSDRARRRCSRRR